MVGQGQCLTLIVIQTEEKLGTAWSFLASFIALSLLVQCPYQVIYWGVCGSSNFVAFGFQSVEHEVRGLINLVSAERRSVLTGTTLCAQSMHHHFHVFALGWLVLVSMELNERYPLPKCPN